MKRNAFSATMVKAGINPGHYALFHSPKWRRQTLPSWWMWLGSVCCTMAYDPRICSRCSDRRGNYFFIL